jgi:hypothetical protein
VIEMATTIEPAPAGTFAVNLVRALNTTWRAIQRHHPDVPDVVVTIGAGTARSGPDSKRVKYGHFDERRWMVDRDEAHELFIGGEGLQRGATATLITLLHEAAHGVGTVRGIQDTSRGGRYHNTRFRDLAAELGVTVLDQVDGAKCQHGWAGDQSLTDDAVKRYRRELARLDEVIRAYRIAEGSGGTGTKRKSSNNGVVAECGCTDPRKIRVSVSVYKLGSIICGICGRAFEADLPDGDDDGPAAGAPAGVPVDVPTDEAADPLYVVSVGKRVCWAPEDDEDNEDDPIVGTVVEPTSDEIEQGRSEMGGDFAFAFAVLVEWPSGIRRREWWPSLDLAEVLDDED